MRERESCLPEREGGVLNEGGAPSDGGALSGGVERDGGAEKDGRSELGGPDWIEAGAEKEGRETPTSAPGAKLIPTPSNAI